MKKRNGIIMGLALLLSVIVFAWQPIETFTHIVCKTITFGNSAKIWNGTPGTITFTEDTTSISGNEVVAGNLWINGTSAFGDAVVCSTNVTVKNKLVVNDSVRIDKTLHCIGAATFDAGISGAIDSTNIGTDALSGTDLKWFSGADLLASSIDSTKIAGTGISSGDIKWIDADLIVGFDSTNAGADAISGTDVKWIAGSDIIGFDSTCVASDAISGTDVKWLNAGDVIGYFTTFQAGASGTAISYMTEYGADSLVIKTASHSWKITTHE